MEYNTIMCGPEFEMSRLQNECNIKQTDTVFWKFASFVFATENMQTCIISCSTQEMFPQFTLQSF